MAPATRGPLDDETHHRAKGRIVIIGAGLAGLTAAYELARASFDVMVIESRPRAGGRVQTHRDSFADGLYAEMGAEYIDINDNYTRIYCKRFGLEIEPAMPYDGVFVRGQRLTVSDLEVGEKALPYEGTGSGALFGQERKYLRRYLDQIHDPRRLPPEVLALDGCSASELLLREGAPPDFLEYFQYTYPAEASGYAGRMSSLPMVVLNALGSGFSEKSVEGRVCGGNDRLPDAFARELGTRILYNCPARAVHHYRDGVEVTFERGGRLESVHGSRVILAVPFSVMGQIDVRPQFSDEKRDCICLTQYGSAMKVALQFKTRFWERAGSLGHRVFTDTALRRIYHFPAHTPGGRGLLLSFTTAADAERLGELPAEKRLMTAVEEVARIWPEAREAYENGVVKYWNEDPWARGSYSVCGVGQGMGFLQEAMRPEGCIHFAGEHTAPGPYLETAVSPTMDRAIQSGIRVSEEILREMGSPA